MAITEIDQQERDIEIVKRCQDDPREETWRVFVGRFDRVIREWIRQMARDCSIEDREDLFQAALMKFVVLGGLRQYRPDKGSFRAYLRTSVYNSIRDAYRKRDVMLSALDEGMPIAVEACLVANQFPPAQEPELIEVIRNYIGERVKDARKLKVFLELIKEVPKDQIARQYDLSRATIFRYRIECLKLAYDALGIIQQKKI